MRTGEIHGDEVAQLAESLIRYATGSNTQDPGYEEPAEFSIESDSATALVNNVLDDLDDQQLRSLSDGDLIQAVTRVEQIGRIVDSLRARLSGEVADRTQPGMPVDVSTSLAHRLGFTSARGLLQHLTGASGNTITRQLRVAKSCRNQMSLLGEVLPSPFPSLNQALAHGQVHMDAADLIVTSLSKLPASVDHQHLQLAEQILTSHATGLPYHPEAFSIDNDSSDAAPDGEQQAPTNLLRDHADQLRIRISGWVTALDQEGKQPREENVERRFLHLGRKTDGLVPIRGAILPEVAAKLGRLIDAITTPRHTKTKSDTESPDHGAPSVDHTEATPAVSPDSGLEMLTPNQKRHDALALIINAAMKHDSMPQLGGEAVTLTIQTTQEELESGRGSAWFYDHHGELAPTSLAAAHHAACSGNTFSVLQQQNGRIISLETTTRIFNAHQRKAIMVRDGGCIIPGCSTPAIWCEIHHIQPHADGGKTSTDNGVLLCWYHHRYLDHHGWQIRAVDGIPQVKAPPWIDPYQKWHTPQLAHKPPSFIT